MNQLIIFYLMTSAIHIVPTVVITLTLKYGSPIPFFPKILGDSSSLNRGLQRIGIARFEQLFKLFDRDIRDYFIKLSLVACVLQILTTILIMLAIALELPVLFIPIIDDRLTTGLMYELLMFAVTTGFIHLLPMFGLVLPLLFRIPLPFMPLTKKQPPSTNEITRWEQNSDDFASIRLTRFENSEKTFIYAHCQDERSRKVFKLVLCQGKEAGDRPQCFLYTDDESTLEQINPAPISINELNEIFISGGN